MKLGKKFEMVGHRPFGTPKTPSGERIANPTVAQRFLAGPLPFKIRRQVATGNLPPRNNTPLQRSETPAPSLIRAPSPAEASQVPGRSAENQSESDDPEEAAAVLVTRTLRRAIAERSNSQMIGRGTIWTTADPQIKSLQSLSGTNVSRLRSTLGRLTPSEISFVDAALKTKWYATHFTRADIRPADGRALAMFSRQKLLERNSGFSFENTKVIDSFLAAHDDCVFFSLEPGVTPKKLSSRFGSTVVRVPMDDPSLTSTAWVSLNDMVNPGPSNHTHLADVLSAEEFNTLTVRKRNGTDYVFAGKDMLPGIVLSIIGDLRDVSSLSREKALASVDEYSINHLVNGLYRPEVKIPRQFFPKDYQIIEGAKDT